MELKALIITNNHRSSMGYVPSLAAYGFHVEETRTFEAARILLHSRLNPELIVIDIKFQADEIEDFLCHVRQEMGNYTARVVVVGCDTDFMRAYGADKCLPRPASAMDILSVIQMVR